MDNTEIAKIINKNGGRLYYVGGCVRDKLMHIQPKDTDFCIVNLTPEKFVELFPKAFSKGASFPVYQFQNCEFAFARKESKISKGHRGFSFHIKNVTLEEDLCRRDITINSIAIDVLTGQIIDPFNGQEDLQSGVLRATSTHFSEDPLRVYRVAQFASRFNFSIEEKTKKVMTLMKNELYLLSAERVFEELKKALNTSTPSIFFDTLKELDLIDVHFPEIANLIDIIQPAKYHPEGDAYTHSMIILDEVSAKTQDEKIRFASLLHDLGKARTPKEILPHHYCHDTNGEQPVRDLCNRLKVPKEWKKLAVIVVKEHMKAGIFEQMKISKKVSFLERNLHYLDELEIIAQVDSKNNNLKFAELGKEMISIVNGNTITLPNDKNSKNVLHNSRIGWLKNFYLI